MKNPATKILVICAFAGLLASAYAESYWWNPDYTTGSIVNSTGKWKTGDKPDGALTDVATEPGSGDTASFVGGSQKTVNLAINSGESFAVNNLRLAYGWGNYSYLTNNGTVTVSDQTYLGYYTDGHGALTQKSGTWTTSRLMMGYSGCTDNTVNIEGGTFRITGGNHSELGNDGASVINLTGGEFICEGSKWLQLGAGGSGTATVNQSGGTATIYGLNVGNNGTGFYNLSGGTLNLGSGSDNLGENAGSSGTFHMSGDAQLNLGATLTVGKNGVGRFIFEGGTIDNFSKLKFGSATPGNSVLEVRGGALTYVADNLIIGGTDATYTDILVTGGVFTVQARYFNFGDKNSSVNTMTINGGEVSVDCPNFGFQLSAMSTVNLNGGTLRVHNTQHDGDRAEDVDVINFNGGVLEDFASDASNNKDLIGNDSRLTLNVLAGGVIIATDNNRTIAASFTGTAGDGGFTKRGTGTLTLTAAPGWTGKTHVEGGKLVLPNGTYTLAGDLYVAEDATLDLNGGTLTVTSKRVMGEVVNGTVNESAPIPDPAPAVLQSAELVFRSAQYANDVWTDGTFTISGTDLFGNDGTIWKFKNNAYTVQVPENCKVYRFTVKGASENYMKDEGAGTYYDGTLASFSSRGANVTLPENCVFPYKPATNNITVTLAHHTPGKPLVFQTSGCGQALAAAFVIEYVPVTPPTRQSVVVSDTTGVNSAQVTITFDTEMQAAEGSVNGGTVTAEGGSNTLVFTLSNLPWNATSTLTIAKENLVDLYGNAAEEDVSVDIVIGSPASLETHSVANNSGTIENNVWSDNFLALASSSGISFSGTGFRLNWNGNRTLSVPLNVKVYSITIVGASHVYDGYSARLTAVTSEGATATLPADTSFPYGTTNDIKVNIAYHTPGAPIVFTLGGGHTFSFESILVEYVTVNPGTAPAEQSRKLVAFGDKNHGIVSVDFGVEVVDATATVNGTTTVSAKGGSTVLTFNVWNLPWNTTSTLVIPAASIVDTFGNTAAEAVSVDLVVGPKPVATKRAPDYVVGTLEELSTALAAIKAVRTAADETQDLTRKVIFLKDGTYDVGQGPLAIEGSVTDLTLVGQSTNVVIRGNGIDLGNPVIDVADAATGLIMQNITVENYWDYFNANGPGQRGGRGLTVKGGKKAIFDNVLFKSHQDTLLTSGPAYFRGGQIFGCVDYIYGGGDVFFDRVNLVMTSGNYLAAPGQAATDKWGYVFDHCRITAAETFGSSTFYLARPWQGEPRICFLNTIMEVQPEPQGWAGWNVTKAHLYEYNSMDADGHAIDLSQRRVPANFDPQYTPVLTAAEAAAFTRNNVLGGTTSWEPLDSLETIPAPELVRNRTVLTWAAHDDVSSYVILENGQVVATTTTPTYTASNKGVTVTVLALNDAGVVAAKSEIRIPMGFVLIIQ